jgi:hypothetical protein
MMRIRLLPPISGGLLLSYRCTAECRHCMYACSPKWKADWITTDDLKVVLYQLSRSIIPSPRGGDKVGLNYGLHFTGGEPFLNLDLLLQAVLMAEEFKIPSTFVETNCYWCDRDEQTREKLRALKQAGLKGILISVNPFYAEYVPFERTGRCIRISEEVFGGNVMVYQLEYYQRFTQLGIKKRLSLDRYLGLVGKDDLTERVELFLMGRAARQLRVLYPFFPAKRFFSEPCQPPVLRDWHNHFDNYGNIMPGYCGGISLGSWGELDKLIDEGIDMEEHPILGFLLAEDIGGLFSFARDMGYQEDSEGYISKCDLCLSLRRYLVSRGDFEELSPKEFYNQLE